MKGRELERDADTSTIIGAAIEVHRVLGRGLKEAIYQRALAVELDSAGHGVRLEREVAVLYKGIHIGMQRLDMVVSLTRSETCPIVVEVKHFDPTDRHRVELARCQCATYLAAAKWRLGLVLNFGGPVLVPSRVLNPNERPAS